MRLGGFNLLLTSGAAAAAAALCSGILKGRSDRGPWMCNDWKL